MLDRKAWLVLILLLFVGGLAYSNALQNPFLFDDAFSIKDNPTIRSLSPDVALWAPWENPLAGRPIANYSFAINYAIGKQNPVGYRVVNLVLHGICAWMLFLATRSALMMPAVSSKFQSHAFTLGFASSLLWLVHPLQSEVINYLTQRTEIFLALFYFLTLFAAIRAWERPKLWTVIAVVACICGVLSKESMVTAPVIVMFFDYCFSGKSIREIWSARRTIYIGLLVTWIILAIIMICGPRSGSVGFGKGISSLDYALTQFWAIGQYLWLSVWPQDLLIDYGTVPQTDMSKILPGAIAIAVGMCCVLATWRNYKPITFGILAFFLVLSPTSSFVPIITEVGAERRVYVPLGFLIPLVLSLVFLILSKVSKKPSAPLFAIFALTVVSSLACILRTRVRNDEFSRPVALWTRAGELLPTNYRAFSNLSKAISDVSPTEYEKIATASREAIERKPDAVEALANLSGALLKMGRGEEALGYATQGLEANPSNVAAQLTMARVLREIGRETEALEYSQRALELQPHSPYAWFERGNTFRKVDNLEEAKKCYEITARDPFFTSRAYNNLGALISRDDPKAAIPYLEKAIASDSKNVEAYCNLGNALAKLGRFDQALRQYQAALEIDPQNNLARENTQIVLGMKQRKR